MSDSEKTVEYVTKEDFLALRTELLKILTPLNKEPDPDEDPDPKRKRKDADPDADEDPKRKRKDADPDEDPDPKKKDADSGDSWSAYKRGQPANQGESAGSEKGGTGPKDNMVDTTKAVIEKFSATLKERDELRSELASIHKALGLTKSEGANSPGSGSSMTKDGQPAGVDPSLVDMRKRWELSKSMVVNAIG